MLRFRKIMAVLTVTVCLLAVGFIGQRVMAQSTTTSPVIESGAAVQTAVWLKEHPK